MKIVCLGGGPAGLYFAISAKLRDPSHQILVVERHAADETFGWGIVFSDQTLDNLRENDPVSAAAITESFAHWDDIEVVLDGQRTRSSGHGFIGIGRKNLLQILQRRARKLGVELAFETEFDDDLSRWADYDLIVASDGVNSRIRSANEQRLGVDIDVRANKFIWLGTRRLFDAFTFIFEKTEAGWIWAHAYRFDDSHSTFIVECSESTWRGLGLDRMEADEALHLCERIFAQHLGGHALINNNAHLQGPALWTNFKRVLCQRWSFDNVVLLGDAAHTAHFSIGSGTKLALEDAIKLAQVLDRPGLERREALGAALEEYRDERQTEVLRIQNSARNSTEWFETLDRYLHFPLLQFAYSLLTRSQRVSHENLRLRDRAWLDAAERWFAKEEAGENPTPPMFTSYRSRDMKLTNRMVVSSVLTYASNEAGAVTDFHLAHYGARALGGAGLVMTEMVGIAPEGRATPSCPGIWNDEQAAGWKRIVDLVHAQSAAKIGIQIGHAGAKAGLSPPHRSAAPAAWRRLAASPVSAGGDADAPEEMTPADMKVVTEQFVAACRRALAADFDIVEIQAAHGYLLSSFISPALNRRSDEYGGSLEARMRFPLEVVGAVRKAWPHDRPVSVRISANDWIGAAGILPDDAVLIAQMLRDAGVDIVDVSSGETSPEGKPVYGRMYQTPMCDQVRNEAGVPTMAVGNIYAPDHANSIIMAGRADLVALGRPHLVNPAWTLHAAASLEYRGVSVPDAYVSGMDQLYRIIHAQA